MITCFWQLWLDFRLLGVCCLVQMRGVSIDEKYMRQKKRPELDWRYWPKLNGSIPPRYLALYIFTGDCYWLALALLQKILTWKSCICACLLRILGIFHSEFVNSKIFLEWQFDNGAARVLIAGKCKAGVISSSLIHGWAESVVDTGEGGEGVYANNPPSAPANAVSLESMVCGLTPSDKTLILSFSKDTALHFFLRFWAVRSLTGTRFSEWILRRQGRDPNINIKPYGTWLIFRLS